MKKLFCLILSLLTLLSLAACTDVEIGGNAAPSSASSETQGEPVIELKGSTASYEGSGVVIQGSVVTITRPGAYKLRGKLSDGRLVVDTGEVAGDVSLTLLGAEISCKDNTALYVAQAKNFDLELAAGSKNILRSGTEDMLEHYAETNSGAALYAEDDLDILGEGSLEIYGYINNGITCKDDFDLLGGEVTIVAANNGVRASESLRIAGGSLTVTSGNDGLKTTSAAKEGKGSLTVEDGAVSVRCGGDGLSAETVLTVSGGSISVLTEGDPALVSCKGLKGKTGVSISGGSISVDAADTALRSSTELTVSGGELALLAGAESKGVTAPGLISISGGSLDILAGDNGVDSDLAIEISGGSLTVGAGKNGLKAGVKGTGFGDTVGEIRFLGGETRISAYTDAIDAKASLSITGGTVLALGSPKNLKLFGEMSSQDFFSCALSGPGNTEVTVSADGETLFTMNSAYGFTQVIFSAPTLKAGQNYTVTNGKNSVTAVIKE